MTSGTRKPNGGFPKTETEPPGSSDEGKSRFDQVYIHLKDKLIPELKRIDLVLIHPKDEKEIEPSCCRKKNNKNDIIKLRQIFEDKLKEEGFIFDEPKPNDEEPKPNDDEPKPSEEEPKPNDEEPVPNDEEPKPNDEEPEPNDEEPEPNDKIYRKLHCSFKRLCIEAEKINLEMPLLGLTEPWEVPSNICLKSFCNTYVADNDKKEKMPNKRNAIGSPWTIREERPAGQAGGQTVQNEEIGAGRKRTAKKTQEVGHAVAEGPEKTTDIKPASYPVSHKFMVDFIDFFKNHHDPRNFFRPSVRNLLVDHILTNISIKADDLVKYYSGDNLKETKLSEIDKERRKISTEKTSKKEDKERQMLETFDLSEKDKVNFLFMEKVGLYTDKMILHEVSKDSKFHELNGVATSPEDTANVSTAKDDTFHKSNRVGTSRQDSKNVSKGDISLCSGDLKEDPRKELNDKWTGFFRLQPMTKIRDYFGEKIAFYFAWAGFLVTSLWLPMLFGLVIFIYGIHKSASNQTDSTR